MISHHHQRYDLEHPTEPAFADISGDSLGEILLCAFRRGSDTMDISLVTGLREHRIVAMIQRAREAEMITIDQRFVDYLAAEERLWREYVSIGHRDWDASNRAWNRWFAHFMSIPDKRREFGIPEPRGWTAPMIIAGG